MNKLPGYVTDVISRLESFGFEAYAVGGCVRDSILGRIPGDYDVTTDALPSEIKACFAGFRVIETGIKHGTVTVISRGQNVEITTYRIDGEYTDNRHPNSVTFTRNLAEDLSRRDFTVNAMAISDTRGLVDLFGGVNDIEDKIIRCVGNPSERFSEDGLRILRALRFASVLGFCIEEKTSSAVHSLKDLLKNISVERILSEFSKLICGKNAEYILRDYRDVIGVFFPEVAECNDETYAKAVEVTARCNAEKSERFAAFAGICGGSDGIKRLLESLNSDNKTKKDAMSIYRLAMSFNKFDKTEARYALSQNGLPLTLSACRIRGIFEPEISDTVKTFSAFVQEEALRPDACLSLSALKIGGRDLMALGIRGTAVGTTLNTLLCEVIEEKTQNTRDALIESAKALNLGDN